MNLCNIKFIKPVDNITVNRYSINGKLVLSMTVQKYMEKKNISRYRLSKTSGIPYTTITDICSGKAKLEKCSAETIYKLAKSFDVTMEELLEPCFEQRSSFELYKSNVCHELKEKGDIQFVIDTLENNKVRMLYDKGWYVESLYLLAMLDYVSRENNVPICTEYDDLRKLKLKETVYPKSILIIYAVSNNDEIKEKAYNESIPEFARFNIVENDVRNVL